MHEGANVGSLDALARFKAALAEYTETSRLALSNAEGDIRRMQSWLSHEQTRYWQQEIKKRTRRMVDAKNELYQAELQSRDSRPSCAVERKKLEHARLRVAEAERKLERVKHWMRVLDKEAMQYRGQVATLSGMLERDMPKAIVRLNKMMDALQKYLKVHAPRMDDYGSEKARAGSDGEDAEAVEGSSS